MPCGHQTNLKDSQKRDNTRDCPYLFVIGMMAAVEQGSPCSTIDYDFWVDLPKRQVVRQ